MSASKILFFVFLIFSFTCGALEVLAQDDAEVTDKELETALDRSSDEAIAQRLRATFSALPDLAPVAVSVEAGVVTLRGSVDSGRSRELAGELAAQISEVAAVSNRIEESRSVSRRLSVALERLESRTWILLESLPLLILALLVVVLAWIAARLLARWGALLDWLSDNPFVRDLLRQLLRFAVFSIGVLLALEILDATALVGAVLGAAGVVGLAVGFAFRDLVENYIASVLLSLRQPFAPNDLVQIGDHEGRVARLTSRATILVTAEGNHVRIPNGAVFKSTIVNMTRKPERRFSIAVGVGVDEDLVAAQDLGVETLRQMDGVLERPGPTAQIEALGDSSVLVTLYGWVDQNASDYLKVKSEATRLVKQAFDRRGIEMPEPIHRLRLEKLASVAPPPPPQPEGEARDVTRDAHLDELVRDEQEGDENLLTQDGNAE